jgi:FkbM family methyltransferase
MILFKNLLFLFGRLVLKPVPHRWKQRIGMDLQFKRLLKKNFPPQSRFSFVQVGGMDGIRFDDLYDFVKSRQANGIIFEPLPDLFEELKKNYAYNKEIVLIQSAVHPNEKQVMMYRVAPAHLEQLPEWAVGIASLDPEHHQRSGIDQRYIEPVAVQAQHLMDAIHKNFQSREIDLLQIDAEGFDAEVLKMVDFTKLKPRIIKFEFVNLSKNVIRASMRLLRKEGYFCFYEYPDAIAVRLSTILI